MHAVDFPSYSSQIPAVVGMGDRERKDFSSIINHQEVTDKYQGRPLHSPELEMAHCQAGCRYTCCYLWAILEKWYVYSKVRGLGGRRGGFWWTSFNFSFKTMEKLLELLFPVLFHMQKRKIEKKKKSQYHTQWKIKDTIKFI